MISVATGFVWAAAAALGTLAGCRLAYGCWPWEWRKTWQTTKWDVRRLHEYQGEQTGAHE